MTQEERWIAKYNEVVEFIKSNHRNPSRHRIEEHDMLNWLKANRKALHKGVMTGKCSINIHVYEKEWRRCES